MQVANERRASGNPRPTTFVDSWKPRPQLVTTAAYVTLGCGLTALCVGFLAPIMPGWSTHVLLGHLDVGHLTPVGALLTCVGVASLVTCQAVTRAMPFKTTIGNEFVSAFLDRGIIPRSLPRSGFSYSMHVNRRNRRAVVRFRIVYPQRTYADVLQMTRGLESSFSGILTTYDLVPTAGKAARRWPLTLVLNYGGGTS